MSEGLGSGPPVRFTAAQVPPPATSSTATTIARIAAAGIFRFGAPGGGPPAVMVGSPAYPGG